jgi:hypothetical protein
MPFFVPNIVSLVSKTTYCTPLPKTSICCVIGTPFFWSDNSSNVDKIFAERPLVKTTYQLYSFQLFLGTNKNAFLRNCGIFGSGGKASYVQELFHIIICPRILLRLCQYVHVKLIYYLIYQQDPNFLQHAKHFTTLMLSFVQGSSCIEWVWCESVGKEQISWCHAGLQRRRPRSNSSCL